MTRTDSTNTTIPAGAARRRSFDAQTGGAWKVAILVGSLGGTALGWWVHPPVERPALVAGDASAASHLPVEVRTPLEPGTGARVVLAVVPRGATPMLRSLPAMPNRPVFQAPVTRTRRS